MLRRKGILNTNLLSRILLAVLIFSLSPASTQTSQLESKNSYVFTENGIFTASGKTITEPDYVANQVIIKIRPEFIREFKSSGTAASTDDPFNKLFAKYGIQESAPLFHMAELQNPPYAAVPSFLAATRRQGLERVYLLTAGTSMDVREAVDAFRKLPEIEYAEPNYIYHTQALTNDPYLTSQRAWGQSYPDLWGVHKIMAPEAWDSATGEGIVVAVIDTGCDRNHADLRENIWSNPNEVPNNGIDDDGNGYIDDVQGWNFVDNNNNFTDRYGHGTHVAGTIAAVGDNGIGIAGIAWNSKIMPVKGLSDSGGGSIDGLANAIVYAAQNGAQVINMSWGGYGASQVIEDALVLAHSLNVVLVASSGNSASDASGFFPAGSRYVITVGASDHNDMRTDLSNWGISLDVLAPGGDSSNSSPNANYYNILSLRSANIGSSGIDDTILMVGTNYLRLRGTSMAAPHVSGVCAMLLEKFPSATPEEIRQILRSTADDVESPDWDMESSYGRINASNAVASDVLGSARIYSPLPSTVSNDQLEVNITAAAQDFESCQLEYGEGEDPDEWSVFYTSSEPIINSTALNWYVGSLPDSVYTIRLRVFDQSEVEFQDRTEMTLDRVVLSSPSSSTAYKAGQIISIRGTAAGGGFSGYQIQYLDPKTGLYSSDGIDLVNGGATRIEDGILGTWDTMNITEANFYNIRLVVKRHNLEDISKTQQVIIDPTLHAGWPQKVSVSGSDIGSLAFLDELVSADIDRDGKSELLIAYGNEVRIYQEDGSQAPGWPQKIDSSMPGSVVQISPAVGDLDGDGYPEIIVGNNMGQVFVWNYLGHLLPGWPKSMLGDIPNISVADVNGDHIPEMVSTDWDGRISVFDLNGHYLEGWPYTVPFTSIRLLSAPAIADLDKDGRKEIVVLNRYNNSLYVLNSDGSPRSGWPNALEQDAHIAWAHPVLADVDGDRKLEIVTAIGSGRIYVFRHNGQMVSGWPKRIEGAEIIGGLTVGDITGDNIAEILIGAGTSDPLLYAWTGSGTIMPGWPVQYDLDMGSGGYGYGSSALIDIDGDSIRDIIADSDADYNHPFALNGYSRDGRQLPGFPKPTFDIGAWPTNTPAIADYDGDGFLEIAWLDLSGNVYMWDTSAPDIEDSGNWTMFHHDSKRTGADDHNVTRLRRPRPPRGRDRNAGGIPR